MSEVLDFLLEFITWLFWDSNPSRAQKILRVAIVVAMLIMLAVMAYGLWR